MFVKIIWLQNFKLKCDDGTIVRVGTCCTVPGGSCNKACCNCDAPCRTPKGVQLP